MEAVINGCPAFAISQEYYAHPDFTLAGRAATAVARNILEHGLSAGELINVNVPAVTPDECDGVRGHPPGQARLPGRAGRAERPARHPLLLDRRPAAVRVSPSRAPTSTPSSTGGSPSRRSISTSRGGACCAASGRGTGRCPTPRPTRTRRRLAAPPWRRRDRAADPVATTRRAAWIGAARRHVAPGQRRETPGPPGWRSRRRSG